MMYGRLVALAGPGVMGSGGPEKVVVPLMALGMDSMALNQLKGQTHTCTQDESKAQSYRTRKKTRPGNP